MQNFSSAGVPIPREAADKKLFIKLKKMLGIFLAIVLLGAVTFGYHELIVKPRLVEESAKQEKYKEATTEADAKIEAIFKKWSAITVDESGAVEWAGAKSEILYVERIPVTKTFRGEIYDETWRLWSRSNGGRVYVLTFWLDERYQFQASKNPEEGSVGRLLSVLIKDKREDLIKKLKLPVKPA